MSVGGIACRARFEHGHAHPNMCDISERLGVRTPHAPAPELVREEGDPKQPLFGEGGQHGTRTKRCIVVLDRQTTPCLIECGGAHATRASHEASAVRLLLGGRAVVLVVDQAEGLLHVLDELARLLRERAGAGATARVGVGVGGSRGVERRREARPEGFGRFGCDARAHLELGSCPPGTSPNPNRNPKP